MEFRMRDVSTGGGQVNIGSGNTNVGRDAIDNRGGVLAGGDVTITLASDLDALTAALDGLRLTSEERAGAVRELAGLRSSAVGERPDRQRAGEHLRRFTGLLRDAGALAAAGAALVEPLTRIARWLGPVGAAVLSLL